MIMAWTSSGETAAFETIELGVQGTVIDLHGVLADSDWLSILEVGILVDDGNDDGAAVVEAGELGPVASSAEFYDLRLAETVGCDPAGCSAALTRDGNMSNGSRWSCAPFLGGSCRISYDLGAPRDLSELRVALYKGNTRLRTMEVSVDGVSVTTWTSSGMTSSFESIDISGYSGEVVSITGVQGDREWLSIIETEIMVLSDGDDVVQTPGPTNGHEAIPTPSPTTTTTPTPVLPPTTVNPCLDPLHADYACQGGEDDGLYPPPDSVVLSDCGLTDADWEDIKACLVVAGEETDTTITTLIMSGNPDITTVPEGLFEVSPSLASSMTWLTLSETKISSLPPGLLDPLSELGFLSLEYNALTTIPGGMFDSLVKLWGLFLTGNDLSELPEGIFDALGALDWLHLQENSFTTLPAGIFDSLPNLTELFLYDNSLSSIPAGVFDNQVALFYLYLHNNDLVTLPADIFEALGALGELRLDGNPSLQCLPASIVMDVPWDGGVSVPPVCGCDPVDAITCADGTTCQPGSEGYTCE
ncbi:unnamed protein product [Ectocarpus sp. 12 AP-2014]